MQCLYCDSQIQPYPADGICPNCGAKLRPDDTPKWQAHSQPVVPHQIEVQHQFVPLEPGINCCARCRSRSLTVKKRGMNWIAAIIGFFLLPPFGLLFGLIGRNKLMLTCQTCSYKWKR